MRGLEVHVLAVDSGEWLGSSPDHFAP